jgi:hypothetical protein
MAHARPDLFQSFEVKHQIRRVHELSTEFVAAAR